MSSSLYNVTYANVPFVTDTAKVIRMPPPEVPYGQTDKQQPIRKQQPEVDFINELNRILPFEYSQDYFLSTYYHNRNLGAIARPSKFGPNPNPSISIWDYYYPYNASRWSVFRGLATSSMVAQILANVVPFVSISSTPMPFYRAAAFSMQQFPNSPDAISPVSYTINTNLYLLPPRPVAEHAGGFDGIFTVTLVDERFFWQFLPLSFEITTSTTWDSLIAQIAFAAGIEINYSAIPAAYGQPEPDSQLWCNLENLAALFDAVASNLGRVVVRNLDGTYSLLTYDESQELVEENRGNPLEVVRFAGGDIFEQNVAGTLPAGNLTASRNAIVPGNVLVSFPQYVVGNDPVPHFVNRRYGNPRPTCWYEQSYGGVYGVLTPITSGGPLVSGLTGVSGYTHCIHDTAKALYSGEVQASTTYTEGIGFVGGVPLNYSGLASLASQITQDYYYGQALEALDESYPGTFAWEPEGIHDLIWRYSERTRQATTRVAKQQWNKMVREMQHSTPYCSGLVSTPGVGGLSVAQTWKDSYSGSISTITTATFFSGGTFLTLNDISYLPTQNRWKAVINSGQLDYEMMLLEGTSGGLGGLNTVGIVQQGIDGTAPFGHANNSVVEYRIPDVTYGVNLPVFEKGQFVYPGEWRSGGIQGVSIVPQTQIIKVLSSGSTQINDQPVYSGQVTLIDTTKTGASQFVGQEYVWAMGASGSPSSGGLTMGNYYGGLLVGYSAANPIAAPIYQIMAGGGGGGTTVSSGSTPQSWQDSFSGSITTALSQPFLLGSGTLTFKDISYFPTQNQWKAVVNSGLADAEILLMNGTSGGLSGIAGPYGVTIALPGADGTTAKAHSSGAVVAYEIPDLVSGVTSILFEKGQFVYPREWQSGSVTGVTVVPQVQTVLVYEGSGNFRTGGFASGGIFYSGCVVIANANQSGYRQLEKVWVQERNANKLTSGHYYEGQIFSYSTYSSGVTSGNTSPIYLVNHEVSSGTASSGTSPNWNDQEPDVPENLLPIPFSGGDVYLPILTPAFLPTSNRWKGILESGQASAEVLLLEGTSGGLINASGNASGHYYCDVVLRGLDGTTETHHASGSSLFQLTPTTLSGIPTSVHELGYYIYPGTDDGTNITATQIAPQVQTVYIYSYSGINISGFNYYSGATSRWDSASGGYIGEKYVLVKERNNRSLLSGSYYDGQFTGYSPFITASGLVSGYVTSGYTTSGFGYTAPVYLVNQFPILPTWQDSFSGSITTNLISPFTSGGLFLTLQDVSYFPTQNRWKAVINSGQADYEVMLLDGTSGGGTISGKTYAVTVVSQGMDGTGIASGHASGSVIAQSTPDTTYEVSKITFEKGQFVYTGDWQSGFVQGVHVVPQIQTVLVFDGSGTYIRSGGGAIVYSGQVNIADPQDPNLYKPLEYVWVEERNGNQLFSGLYYGGQLFSYSTYLSGQTSGVTAPIYLVNQESGGGGGSSLITENTDLTQIVNPTNVIQAHNTFSATSGFKFGRLQFTSGAGSGVGTTILDWQGIQVYNNSVGLPVGPEPDLFIVNPSNGLYWTITDNTSDKAVHLRVDCSGFTGNLSQDFVTGIICSGGVIEVTTKTLTLDFSFGLCVSGFIG